MFNTNFNTNFQNTPNQIDNYNSYTQSSNLGNALNYGQNMMPYGLSTALNGQYTPYDQPAIPYPEEPMMEPQPLQGNNMEANLYPLQSLPLQNNATDNFNGQQAYAKGGRVELNNFPRLAKMLQGEGEGRDKILAHINPEEAALLAQISGGDINPVTGLPQFGLFNNPKKWLASVASPAAGVILGNILLPGLGGIIGGALGGAAGSAIRGRKDYLQSALRGGAMGLGAPTLASGLGWGATKLGASGLGAALSNYGTANAILPSLGFATSGISGGGAANLPTVVAPSGNGLATAGAEKAAERGFLETLGSNTKSFLTKPKNLLTLASTAAAYANRPKEKTPEQIADEQKRLQRALRMTTEELREWEASELAKEQSLRRIQRNKFLPEEGRFGNSGTVYRKTHTPDEYNRTGSWFSYYDNPGYGGNPIPFKEGGRVPEMRLEEFEITPRGIGYFLEGNSGGQDDNRRMDLPEGAYTLDASTLSDIGDGNSRAGANIVKALVSDGEMVLKPEEVAQFAKYGAKNLDHMVKNVRKHKRGGRTTLPPKAKSLTEYLRG